MALDNIVLMGIAAISLVGTLWLYRLNRIMQATPKSVLDYSPHRWTKEEIQATYDRLAKSPLDFTKVLPPKLERRYVVIGGSGESRVLTTAQSHGPTADEDEKPTRSGWR